MNLSEHVDVKIINGKAVILTKQLNHGRNGVTVRNHNEVHMPLPSEEQEESSKMAAATVEESQSEEVFTPYKCFSLPSHYKCVIHPGMIVEAGSLSAQNMPMANYNVLSSLPEKTITEGKISDLQMEGILFACQRHQLVLPDGNRAGFFLGDGTGVGKGRQISGIILDNYSRGRKKHIWFSISHDLRHDAIRDLNDIGCYLNVIDGCQKLDHGTKAFGLVSEYQEGVLFSTYSTLVSSTLKDLKKLSRLDQLIKWCGGKDFSGCLIFDECHKAKHFIPGKEKSSTKVALAVTSIQRLLPKARVLYCSATGVTDVKNMAFMERLGLWGAGTTFQDFESFLDSINKRGLGALEMLSMEMKAAGMYMSRGLSYKEAEFFTIEATLTDAQVKVYNKSVHICMSMKVPEIVRLAQDALEKGCSVVIGLQTTGEASLDSELDQNDGNVDGFVSLTREILKRFIFQFFPTESQQAGKDAKPDAWCVQAKTLLFDFAEKMHLPNSPLDEIINALGGPNNVAEMTGRKGFVGRHDKKHRPKYFTRGGGASNVDGVNVTERNAFMNGDKLVAIISDAASTGISIHADVRAGNQRRRVHITAELPWSADKAVQQLGRSHRSNQSSGPIYKLVTSNLGGEARFAAAVAKRLQSLGAITKGDRRAATGADLTQFNFDTNYGKQALKAMYEAISQRQICLGLKIHEICRLESMKQFSHEDKFNNVLKECLLDMDVLEQNVIGASVLERHLKDVGKFLNRILGLEVSKQNLIFNYFCKCMDATTEAAKREGRYNEGVTDIRGNSIVMVDKPKVIFKEIQLGASVTRHVSIVVDRGVPFSQAMTKFNENLHNDTAFYSSKRNQYGKKLFLLAIQKERSNHLFTVMRPNTGLSPFEEEKIDLLHKYNEITPEDAETGWTEQYDRTKERCIHGDNCKQGSICRVGSRLTEVHLLTGRTLSILPQLETVVARFAHVLQLPREYRNLRVVRVELDDGERLVGLRYPENLIPEAETFIKEQLLLNKERTGQSAEAVVEPETPVNNKLRSKAMTKPPTIKTFFQPKNSSTDISTSDRIKSAEAECDFSSQNHVIRSSSNDHVTPSSSYKENTKTKQVKRTLGGTSSNGKRSKQANIFNVMFAQSQKKKSRTCPVCKKSLDGLTNSDVNKHIDSCIID